MTKTSKSWLSISIGIIIILLLLIAFGSTDGSPDKNQPKATSTGSTSTHAVNNVPENWQTYQNARFDFSVAHPPEASVRSEGPSQRHIKFTFLGPENATGEITDGFTFTVSTYENVTSTLQSFAKQQANSNPVADSVSEVKQVSIGNKAGYRYSTQSLGTIQHFVFGHSNNRAITASYNVSDPNNQGYERMVRTMLDSLQLTAIDGGDEAGSGVVNEIQLALLDTDLQNNEEPEQGCDRVAMVTRDIEPTQAPLTTALESLFSLERTNVQGFHNFIAKTSDTLSFDHARVQNGVAHVYLNGELSGVAGVCDNPRARIQIESTALQFPSVESVQIYVNDEPTDLQPSGRN